MRVDAQDYEPDGGVDGGVTAGDGEDLRAQWQGALDDWPAPACVVDERLQVLAVNAPAAASGLTVGAGLDTVLAVLGAANGTPHDSCTLRWQAVRDHPVRGWLIGRSDDSGLPAVGTPEPASTAQRLAASNLRLQEEISRRRRLERQILAVAENEKQRISLELHDGLGQHLTGVSFVARTLADKLRYAQHAEAQEAEWLVRLLNEAITRTRALARGLWPVSLERDTLGQSVRKLAEDLESIFGVSCAVQVVDEPRIASQFAAHHVFRIVQEAATNAIKHGRARRLTFRLEMVGDEFTICVMNDGLPVDPEQLAAGKGLGVVGMRLRADAVGGHLSIEPLPGGGSEVTLSLPGVASVQGSDVEE